MNTISAVNTKPVLNTYMGRYQDLKSTSLVQTILRKDPHLSSSESCKENENFRPRTESYLHATNGVQLSATLQRADSYKQANRSLSVAHCVSAEPSKISQTVIGSGRTPLSVRPMGNNTLKRLERFNSNSGKGDYLFFIFIF